MSLNKVMLIGNVGMDPEVRYLDSSQAKVARLRIATTESYTDRNGEKRENTEWHTVTCWRRLADLVERYVKKGTQLYIEGRLQTREWTDQTGNKRYSTEVMADNVQLLGRREQGPASAPQTYGQGGNSAPYQQPAQSNIGGYQAPYQPSAPAQAPAQAHVNAAPVPSPQDFAGEGDDDLPF